MTLPSLTKRKRFTLQGLLLFAFFVALALPAAYLAFQPSSDVEGQTKEPPDLIPEVSLGDIGNVPVDEGSSFRVR